MPSTYESKVTGSFILSVKCDRPFELVPCKWSDNYILDLNWMIIVYSIYSWEYCKVAKEHKKEDYN